MCSISDKVVFNFFLHLSSDSLFKKLLQASDLIKKCILVDGNIRAFLLQCGCCLLNFFTLNLLFQKEILQVFEIICVLAPCFYVCAVVKNDLDVLRKDSLEITPLSTSSLSPLTKTRMKFSSHPAVSFASRFLRTAACSTAQH